MKIVAAAVLFSILLNSNAIGQRHVASRTGIKFLQNDFRSALSKGRQSHKLIFVDAYATWCGPCQEMKQQTFKNGRLAAYFNTHYVSVSIDVEKGDGVAFAQNYDVNVYPTLLFLNTEGKVIKRVEGFVNARQLSNIAASLHE